MAEEESAAHEPQEQQEAKGRADPAPEVPGGDLYRAICGDPVADPGELASGLGELDAHGHGPRARGGGALKLLVYRRVGLWVHEARGWLVPVASSSHDLSVDVTFEATVDVPGRERHVPVERGDREIDGGEGTSTERALPRSTSWSLSLPRAMPTPTRYSPRVAWTKRHGSGPVAEGRADSAIRLPTRERVTREV